MNLELRHLRVVVTIAETGSVTKAAALLGLAQPALTAQLQRIERTLGGPLFERDRRGARPTALGELVLDRARVLLPAVKGLQDDAARLAGTGAAAMSRFRIGAVSGDVILGGLVQRLTVDQPDARISTHASWESDELAEMMIGGRLDYALVGVCGNAAASVGEGLVWKTVAMDPVFVLMPQAHPLAGHDEVDLADLADAAWAAQPGDGEGCFGDCFAAACARAGFTPRKLYETDQTSCLDLVEGGHAVGLARPTFRGASGVVIRPLAESPLSWRQLLGWHPDSAAALFGERVLGHAAAAYADQMQRRPEYAEWLRHNPRFGAQPDA